MNSKFFSLLFSTTLAGVVLVSLVDAAAKSFVLLCLAVVVCLALRRAPAAARHLIWLSTLAATLALPLLSLCVPQWRVLPEWMDVTRGGRGSEPFVAAFPPIPTLPDSSQTEPVPQGDIFPPADLFPPMDEASEQALESLRASGVDPNEALNGGWAALGVIRLLGMYIGAVLATALLIVWGVGAVVLLWPMVRSAWMLHRLARSLGVVTNGPVAAANGAIAHELGIPTPLLYLGSAGAMPMVWGVRRGRLLLPAEATEWDAVRLRAVLLHELAHLRRYDPLTQAIAQVARALHWFNPLAWLALRNLRVEQERACDDYVLRGGVKPNDYAGHVLELATQLQPAPRAASVALAMADRTRIEGRLHTILDAARDRRSVSRWLAALTVLIAGSAALSLAMLQAADGKSDDASADAAREQPAENSATVIDENPKRLNYFTTGHSITIACSADGKRIAVANGNPTRIMQVGGTSRLKGGWKPTADILDAETGKIVASLKLSTGDEDAVLAAIERITHVEATALAFSPDGNLVAVGTSIGQVKLFNARTGELVLSLDDKQAKLADHKTAEQLKPLARAMGSVASLAFSPDGSLLSVCGESFGGVGLGSDGRRQLLQRSVTGPGRLKVWEVKTGTLKHDLVGHSHAYAVAFSPDGKFLASAGSWVGDSPLWSGVILWNPQTGEKVRTITKEANGHTHAVAFSPNSKLVVFGSRTFDKDSDTGTTAVTLAHAGTGIVEWQQSVPGWANPKAFSPDGSRVVVLRGQSIHLLDAATGTVQRELKATDLSRDGRWNDFAIAPQGNRLVIGAVDEQEGSVEVWDFERLVAAAASTPGQAEIRDTPAATPAESDKPKTDAPAVSAEPKDARSRPLFEDWKSSARRDGKIPGGRIGEMAASLKTYMDLNEGTEAATKCEAVLKKCDATHDWTPAEAAALLDEIEVAAPSRAFWAMRTNIERKIRPGKPLPGELADAPWGTSAENGLRTAWLLEPRAQTQALDSVMKSRVLFHNAGDAPVCFATEEWIQLGGHKAKDAGGKDISVWALSREGIRTRMVFRLAPGEYAEVEGHGIGVGPHETSTETSIYIVGCWIEAKEGDAVNFTPGSVPVSFQTWQNNEGRKDSTTVWREMIAVRVAQESPMPAAVADREQLLRRVILDLLGTAPTAEEVAAFTADSAPDALAKLTKALQARTAAMHFAGELSGGTTKFRVTAAVPKKDEPKQGAKLQPGTEKKLEWGEPVHGLRMALAWPPTLGEPAAGEVPDLFLAVQNVSAAPVRLCTTAEAPNQRRLSFATNGVLQGRIVSSEPNGADVTLQPREVVFLRLFTERAAETERVPHGSMLAATVRQSPMFTLQADLEIAKAPAGAWTGKLVTPDTRAGIGAEPPKNRKAQELFKVWLAHARVNGKIPGGCIARLGDKVKEFVRGNLADKAGEPYAKRMEPLVSRLDGSRDWQPAEASALLTDIAAVSDVPMSVMLEELAGGTIQYGPSLRKELENAPWGEALPNGLRVACLLEPRAAAYRLGTPLKMRILVHNAGEQPVVFRARTWHHIEPTARDAKGAEIEMESVQRFTRPPLVAHRLVPGGFVELASPGIGIGKYGFHNFKNADIASWVSAKDGDEVTLTPGPVPLGDWNEASVVNGEPRWWLDFLTARLTLATPLPADAAERTQLLQQTLRDIFYADATAEEIAVFIADREPNALESLAKRLAGRTNLTPFSGSLQSGTTKFRVTAADPGAAKPTDKPAANSAPAAKPAAETRESPTATLPKGESQAGQSPLIDPETKVEAIQGGQRLKLTAEAEQQTASLVLELLRSASYIAGVEEQDWDYGLLRSHVLVEFSKPQLISIRHWEDGRQEEFKFQELLLADNLYVRSKNDVRAWTKFSPQKLERLLRDAARLGEAVTVTGWRESQAVETDPDTAKDVGTKAMNLLLNTERELESAQANRRWKEIAQQPHLKLVFATPRRITLRWTIDGKPKDQRLEVSELAIPLPNVKDQDPDSALLVRSGDKLRAFTKSNPEHWMRESSVWFDLYQVLKAATPVRTETRAERVAPAATPPKDKYVQELFKIWQAAARSDGKIPGGLIGQLQAKVEEFVKNNRNDFSGAPYAKKVEPILPRFHANHDWLPDLALGLLNDLAALSSIPIETTLWADAQRRVYPGQPLPADLKDAPWGEPTAEGLRVARPLDPQAKSYPVGMALRSRILLHNDGKEPVLVRTESFMQPGYAARDAMGNPLQVEATEWTTLARVQTWRLAPGEFIEIPTPGLGVGKGAGRDEWADVRVGSWIDVAAGVEVTLSPGSFDSFINDSRVSNPANRRELKLAIIRERLDIERPLPASAADRELIVRRVTQDIFGDEPTPDEIAAFVTDKSDDPFTALANRLLRRAGLAAFVGELKPGEITFRTTPADPDAANRPKVAIGPGVYTLDAHVGLNIVGKPVDGRRTSDVQIQFWSEKAAEGPPYKIQVPDGFGTWAITCRPGTGILWVLTSGALRKIDYSNPAGVKETFITRGSSDDIPDEFREAVKRILIISNVPAEQIRALLAGSAPDESSVKDYAKLQGTWNVSSVTQSDVDPQKASSDLTFLIRKDRLIWQYPDGREDANQFQLSASKNPKQIDFQWRHESPGGEVEELRGFGIYSLEGDKLKFCFSTVYPTEERLRPTDFTAKSGAGRVLLVLERASAPSSSGPQTPLVGTWELTEYASNGKRIRNETIRAELAKDARVVFSGATMSTVSPKSQQRNERPYKLDADKDPKHIEFAGPDQKTLPGIYRFDGDWPLLCFADPEATEPPTQFESKPGSHHILWTLKKVEAGSNDKKESPEHPKNEEEVRNR